MEATLLQAWIEAGRSDDLVAFALDEFELQDGKAFCATLGQALSKRKDVTRIEKLFLGLGKTREASFWRMWPQAQNGHIGAMREAAAHLANSLDALAGLYHCYRELGDEQGKERTRLEMLRLQERKKAGARSRRS